MENNRIIKMKVAAFIVRFHNGKYQLLIQEHMNLKNARVPGGSVERGETISEALKREIFEETGIGKYEDAIKLGTTFYYKEYINRFVERHDFIIAVKHKLKDNWTYKVTGMDKDKGLEFKYRWINFHQIHIVDKELTTFLEVNHLQEKLKGVFLHDSRN